MADDIYASPDGQLTFTVSRHHDGVDLGFEGVAWHTLNFFDWAYQHGAEIAEELDCVPVPSSVARLVEESWKEIKNGNGKSIW